jgi:hypothetical protein
MASPSVAKISVTDPVIGAMIVSFDRPRRSTTIPGTLIVRSKVDSAISPSRRPMLRRA